MEDSSRHVIGYPVQNVTGYSCTAAPPPPPPSSASGTAAYPNVNPKPYPSWVDYLFIAIMVSMLIFVIAISILSAVLDPHHPDFSIQSLSLSNYNSTTNHGVTATWTAQFQVSNPNKKATISYRGMDSFVLYKDFELAGTRMGPLKLGARNSSRVVDASYAMVDAYVDGKTVDAMNAEMRTSGQVKFNVMVFGYVKFGNIWLSGVLPSEKCIRVWCNDVALTNASVGKMTGGPKTCKVRAVRY
ncbi:Late embryogenesis abundant protein, LEA-14 [Corchorus capsularis]|uniref:Late embryogenesis abundant protein, LEA-14 n=1 Tax=Corchorus capsularis TaxID=210143 RepID=A0A1R3GNJ9_COCAP|nr:Late embryogenesis abundant protein, LEA-14 [Corchorus capsularis]